MQGAHPSIEARVDDAVSMLITILSGSYPLLPAIARYLRAVFSLALLEPSYNGHMCGRFAVRFTGSDLVRYLSLDGKVLINYELSPRFNIAPSQPIGALRHTRDQSWQLDSLNAAGPDSRSHLRHSSFQSALRATPGPAG